MTATATALTCSARVGYWPGEWSEMPLFCSTSIGLTRYTDTSGIERRYCRHHGALVRYRYPEKPRVQMYEGMGDDEWDSRKDRIDSAILADPERPL